MLRPSEIIVGVILLVFVLIYYLNKIPRHKSEKHRLIVKYRKVQSVSLKLQEVLSNYVLANDASQENLAPGITYGECLRKLQREHVAHLSKKTFLQISNSNNKRLLRKIDQTLDDLDIKLNETSQFLDEGQKKSPETNSELSIIQS
jgi:hypothetical protein